MTMQILNADYWSSYVQPYVADLGVALVFGVGYYLFKHLHKDKPKMGSIKEKIEIQYNKWNNAKTIQKFNSLIISNTDRKTDAFKILSAIQKAGMNPDIVTYNCLLDMSYRLEQLEQAKKLFEEISDFTSPVQPDTVTFNILLKGCVAELKDLSNSNFSLEKGNQKGKILEKILQIVRDLKIRGINMNEITYNTAIDAFIQTGDFNLAWDLYNEMKESSTVKPDLYTYATLIKGLKSINEPNSLGRAIELLEIVKSQNCENLKADEVLYNSVLDICIKFQNIEMAEKLFVDMKNQGISPSIVTFSIMIKGYGLIFKLDKAIESYNEMRSMKIKSNDIIYGCLLNCAVRCSRLDIMTDIYESLLDDGIKPNQIIYTTLIKGFNKMKKYEKAFEVFDEIPEEEKLKCNIVIYNAILDCCVESQNYEKLSEIYSYIKSKSENIETFAHPNVITYSTVIKGFAKSGRIEQAKNIYSFLKENAFQLDEVLFNTVCDGFARANQNDLALQVLSDMRNKNVARTSIIYSILIKMYSNQGNEQRCLELFQEMKDEGVKPSLVTYTTLMQMFIKKKKVLDAVDMFNDLKSVGIKPDHVCYNFIINGCTFNQKLEKAIDFLMESLRENVRLSEETYKNCLEYLLNNKFMKHFDRVDNAKMILKELKEMNININYDLYSRVMRLIYNNNSSNGEVEDNLRNLRNNFNNFTDLSETGSIYEMPTQNKPVKRYNNHGNQGYQKPKRFYNNFN